MRMMAFAAVLVAWKGLPEFNKGDTPPNSNAG